MSAWINYLNQAMGRAQDRAANQKLSGLLYTPGQMQTQEQAGPFLPGQDRPQVTAMSAPTGLLANNPQYGEFAAQAIQSPYGQQVMQGLLSQMNPQGQEPTQLMRHLSAAGYMPGTPEYQQAIKDYLMKAQTQINLGLQKPLGADASQWSNEKGEKPSPMMTMEEASAKGFTPKTTEELKTTLGAEQASPAMANMLQYGFGKQGEKSLFPPESAGLLDRATGGAQAWLKGATDSDKRLSLYAKNQKALVTGLARLVGQVGTLTDRDVDTVAGLFPTPGLTPEPIAKEQFRTIAKLLMGKGVPQEKLQKMGFPGWAFGQKDKSITEMSDEELRALINGQ